MFIVAVSPIPVFLVIAIEELVFNFADSFLKLFDLRKRERSARMSKNVLTTTGDVCADWGYWRQLICGVDTTRFFFCCCCQIALGCHFSFFSTIPWNYITKEKENSNSLNDCWSDRGQEKVVSQHIKQIDVLTFLHAMFAYYLQDRRRTLAP